MSRSNKLNAFSISDLICCRLHRRAAGQEMRGDQCPLREALFWKDAGGTGLSGQSDGCALGWGTARCASVLTRMTTTVRNPPYAACLAPGEYTPNHQSGSWHWPTCRGPTLLACSKKKKRSVRLGPVVENNTGGCKRDKWTGAWARLPYAKNLVLRGCGDWPAPPLPSNGFNQTAKWAEMDERRNDGRTPKAERL